MEFNKEMKLGVVLSGGFSKGAYQIGFIKALTEKINRNQIEYVSGASIGICNAYALAANKVDEIIEIWQSINKSNVFSLWKELVVKGFLKKNIKKLIEKYDVLDIPTYLTTLSFFPKFSFNYVNLFGPAHINWRDLIRGSIGFPFVTGSQIYFNKKFYTDGAIVDNIPVSPLLNKDLDLILVLHFDSKFDVTKHCGTHQDNILDIDLSSLSNFKESSFNFSQKNIDKMINFGYEYGIDLFEKISKTNEKNELTNLVNTISLEDKNARNKHNSLDKWGTRLNKLFKRLRLKNQNKINFNAYIDNLNIYERLYFLDYEYLEKFVKRFNFLLFLFSFAYNFIIILTYYIFILL